MKATKKLRSKPPKRAHIFAALAALGLIALIFVGLHWLLVGRFLISTDDAYVQGDIAAIAPKLSAYIQSVPAVNQAVRKGDVLFELDAEDYRLALAQAEAELATQARSLERIETQIAAAQSNLREAEANAAAAQAVETNAGQILERAGALQKQQYAPQSALDKAQSEFAQADANRLRALAQTDSAKANIAVLQAQYREADSRTASLRLARDKAARDLSFTVIRAPFDGIIGNLTGKKGDFVVNGQKLAALVPTEQLYIDANYKETQLPDIYGGETAYISIDGYKGGRFKGTVLSLAPATGAVFSILPPQNATGNFTKVVQRVPVRIAIPASVLASGRIRAGMSAEVEIDRRTKPKNAAPIISLPQSGTAAKAEADSAPAASAAAGQAEQHD